MQNLTFDSIQQPAKALNIPEEFLSAARREGCLAFVHGRVRADMLAEFLLKNMSRVNALTEGYWPRWKSDEEPPKLRRTKLEAMKVRIAKLAAEVAPQKRHRGREIAAAVKRELGPELAARLVAMTPGAAALELQQVRDRILTS
jgi:hypothetical protein